MTLHSFSPEDLERRQGSFMGMWRVTKALLDMKKIDSPRWSLPSGAADRVAEATG